MREMSKDIPDKKITGYKNAPGVRKMIASLNIKTITSTLRKMTSWSCADVRKMTSGGLSKCVRRRRCSVESSCCGLFIDPDFLRHGEST
jgi:hypothetical protein